VKLQWPFRRESDVESKGLFIPATLATEFGLSGMRAPGSNVDYAAEVRNGMHSSVITSALAWMMRTFPEAPCVVQRSKEERWENVPQHPLTNLLRRPNPEYDGSVLWAATIMDFCFGEAFWLKIRNGNDDVVELYWVPRQKMTPIASQTTGLRSHYEYTPGYGPKMDLSLDDVVHFRFGMDPNNILRGFSPLAAVMREVYIDDAAAGFTAAILKNLGIIGAVFSPKEGTIPQEQSKALMDYVQSKFTGDGRGKAMLFTGPMLVDLLQYNLQGFDAGPIRDIAEERVSAALAIPAAVIGYGTGLQQTKVGATMREMVKLAWQGGIEPLQRIMAGELDRSLLPDFQANANLFRTWFDTSQVEALTESPMERTQRVSILVEKNIIKVTQAQRELGYPVDASQDKYARELAPTPAAPSSTDPTPKPADDTPAEPPVKLVKEADVTNINIAPQPVNLSLTMEAPRAGTKKQSGTMERIDGKLVVTMSETTDDELAPTNGDGSHDAA
jgi:phage portal protein BeeE